MYQKFIFMGHSTAAVKAQQPEGKTAYADFTVAVNRNQDSADFFPVRCFDRLVDVAARIKKGSLVLVEGRIEIRQFSPKEGETRTTVRVLAEKLRLLNRVGLNTGHQPSQDKKD
jgi:single-strand DNA-binding protein